MYLWTPPVLNLESFRVQKISWWSDRLTLMTPFWETLKGKLAKIRSNRVEVLEVTRVGHWICCFKPFIVQNWWYFLAWADAHFVQTVLFSWTIYLLFWYLFRLKSPRMYVSFASVSKEGKFLFKIRESCFGKAIWK